MKNQDHLKDLRVVEDNIVVFKIAGITFTNHDLIRMSNSHLECFYDETRQAAKPEKSNYKELKQGGVK